MDSGESKEKGLGEDPDETTAHQPVPASKPALAIPTASPTPWNPASKKSNPTPPHRVPFHQTQNFAFAMVAVVAVCLTITVLAITGNLGSGPRPAPFAKKEKPSPSPAQRTSFKSTERSEIKDMVGIKITVTGEIERLEQDEKGRYLIFKDSDPRRDVIVFFNKTNTETSEWILKRKFVGQKVRASGTVKLDGGRLLLELTSVENLKLHADNPAAANKSP